MAENKDKSSEDKTKLQAANQQLKAANQQLAAGKKELLRQADFLTKTIESLTYPFYVIDANDYTVKLANSAGYSGQLPKKTTCYMLARKQDKPCDKLGHTCILKEIKKTGKPVTVEHLYYDKEENPRNIEVHGYPVFDDKGNLLQVIEYCIDITKRKQAEEALEAANQQLQATEQQLRAANQQLRTDEEQLKRVNHDMVERIEELNCLSGLSELIEQYNVDTEEIFTGLIDLIPPAWQYPDVTCARIIVENKELKTTNFKLTKWIQSADINVSGQKAGVIEVCYLKEMPAIDEGLFLNHESKLIETIAHRLGKLIEHRKTTEQTKVANQQLIASNQQLQATEQQLRAANQQLKAEEQQLKALNQQLKANEKELRQSRAGYKAIFDFTMNGIAVYEGVNNGKDFIFKNLNPAAEKIENIKKQDLLGKSVQEVFPGIEKMGLLDVFRRVWKTGKEEFQPTVMYKDERIEGWRENHVFKLLSGDVVAVYRDLTELKQAEEQIKDNQGHLRALTSRLSSIEERERKHIAEGIHDSIIQPLVFLDVKVKSLLNAAKDNEMRESFGQMRTILAELVEKSRTFTFDLSYPILYELGLETAIEEWLQTEIKDKHEMAVEFRAEIQTKDLDQSLVTFLFKSVKELLINVVKHAKASKVKVSVVREQNNIILCVEDDGCGFVQDSHRIKQGRMSGFGLFNIREQLTYLGGNFNILSKPGVGSEVVLTVPLESKV